MELVVSSLVWLVVVGGSGVLIVYQLAKNAKVDSITPPHAPPQLRPQAPARKPSWVTAVIAGVVFVIASLVWLGQNVWL